MIIAQTDRLTLSKITLDDAPFFYNLMNTSNFKRYIGDRNIQSVDDAKEYLKKGILKSYQDHGFSYYKIEPKEALGNTIGIVGILKREQLEFPDIGFAFLPEHEGKGYGFEASQALMKIAKKEFKIEIISAITLPENNNSIKLIEKLGLKLEKRVTPFDNDEELLLFAKTL